MSRRSQEKYNIFKKLYPKYKEFYSTKTRKELIDILSKNEALKIAKSRTRKNPYRKGRWNNEW